MSEHEGDWLIEFVHQYDDGFVITKRGLDASPLVVKKYGLGRDEVMAFSCHQRANKAMTAFHFHPNFPMEERPFYMRGHDEGHAIAASIGSRLAAGRAQKRRLIEERAVKLGRDLAVGLQSVAVLLAAGSQATR